MYEPLPTSAGPSSNLAREAAPPFALSERGSRRSWIVVASLATLLAFASILVYARVFDARFVAYDDDRHIALNENLNPPSWEGLARHWSRPFFGLYAPVAYSVFASEAWLAERESIGGARTFDPRVFHIGNVLLHAVAVLLVFAVLRRLVADDIAAALGALLFAWHPLQVESVAWISETRGTLAGIFSLVSIYAYLRFDGVGAAPCDLQPTRAHTLDSPASRSRGHWFYYLLACTSYVLALLCKPSAVSVPLILMVIDVILLRRSFWRSLGWLGWWLVPAVAIARVTTSAQAEALERFSFYVSWWQRPFVAGDAISFYLLKLVAPVRLAIDYGRRPPYVLASPWTYVAWLLPLALLLVLARLPQRRAWLTAMGIFVAGILPMLGLMTFAFQENSTVGDRYVYLAMLGPAFAVTWLVGRAVPSDLRIETSLVLLILGGLTVYQTGFWHDSRTLFDRALEINPRSIVALNGRAVAAIEEGDLAEAERLLQRAIEIKPRDATPLTNLGIVYEKSDRDDEAIAAFQRAIEARPDAPTARLFLGMIYFERREWDKAIDALERLVEINPNVSDAHLYLGVSKVNSARAAESIEHWEAILHAQPDNIDAHAAFGDTLLKLGRTSEARAHFEAILKIHPEHTIARKYLDRIDSQPPAPASDR